MDIQNILSQLTAKFGNNFDVAKVTESIKGMGNGNFSIAEIIEKVKGDGLIGDLDGDGVKESVFEEIKGKIGNLFG